MKIRMSVILPVLTCLFGLTGFSYTGQTIASPAIYGAFNQSKAQCIIGNSSASTVSVEVKIFPEEGTGPVSKSCSVQPNFICSVTANISSGVAYACSATVTSGSVKKLCGTMVLEDLNGIPLRSAELR
jgi:hypothetical protein